MSDKKFYICRKCGNIVGMINNSGAPLSCCGQPMEELIPGAVDAAQEKHVPVVEVKGNTVEVTVGSVLHPSTPEHYIPWIYIQTDKGGQRRTIEPGEEPKAVFVLADGVKPVRAYAYCNLHGLWSADI